MAITYTHVEAGQPRKFLEFLKFRSLIYFFTWREHKVRYKQTFFGVSWAILQPLLFAEIISVVLTRRAGLRFGYEHVSDLVVIFLGFSIWQYFQGAFGGAVNSISSNKGTIKKIYFPKVILLISTVVSKTVDYFLQMLVFLGFLLFTDSSFSWAGVAFLLVVPLILAIASLAIGLIFAPMNVKYHDISLILPFITRLMFFTTPIWYPFSILPETLQKILLFNPIVAVLEFSRNILFDIEHLDLTLLLYPLFTVSVLLLIGIPYFKRKEGSLADYI